MSHAGLSPEHWDQALDVSSRGKQKERESLTNEAYARLFSSAAIAGNSSIHILCIAKVVRSLWSISSRVTRPRRKNRPISDVHIDGR